MTNYIRIENIHSQDVGNGRRETTADYHIFITTTDRKAVVGVISKLLEHMNISPLDVLLWRDGHNGSLDRSTGIEVSSELLRRAAGLDEEDEA